MAMQGKCRGLTGWCTQVRPELDEDGWDEEAERPVWVSWMASIRRALTVNRFCGAVVLHQVLPKKLTAATREALVPVMADFNAHVEETQGQRNASWQVRVLRSRSMQISVRFPSHSNSSSVAIPKAAC